MQFVVKGVPEISSVLQVGSSRWLRASEWAGRHTQLWPAGGFWQQCYGIVWWPLLGSKG